LDPERFWRAPIDRAEGLILNGEHKVDFVRHFIEGDDIRESFASQVANGDAADSRFVGEFVFPTRIHRDRSHDSVQDKLNNPRKIVAHDGVGLAV
jgi:hypothetical protein